MAKNFLVSLDLNKNELQNARIQNLASDPGTPVEGQIYYNTSTDNLRFWDGTIWVGVGAGLTTEQIEDLVGAMLTGTQTGITVTYDDLNGELDFVGGTLDTLPAPAASLNMNSQTIEGLAAPVNGTDAANKTYVDAITQGLSWKDSVRVATTTAGTLASDYENGDTVDGVTLATNDRILIKDLAAGASNGIYVVQATGAPARAADANTAALLRGAAIFVEEGSTNGDSAWVLSTDSVTLDTTTLVFAQFGAGATYSAGNGISLAGTVFSVAAGTGLTQDASGLSLSSATQTTLSGSVQQVTALVGDGSALTYTVTHNWATSNATVSVRNTSTGVEVETDVTFNTNTVVVGFAVAPTTNQYTVVVQGVPA